VASGSEARRLDDCSGRARAFETLYAASAGRSAPPVTVPAVSVPAVKLPAVTVPAVKVELAEKSSTDTRQDSRSGGSY
jgi:hypothetical protein